MIKEDVYNYLKLIPKGYVSTYKDIANYYNSKAYRAVGNILHANDDINIPCYKIVNNKGYLANNYKFGGLIKQKERLINDGIEVIDNRVNLDKYRFSLLLETDRLYLRRMNLLDYNRLKEIMNDEVMFYYEHHFTDEDIYNWLLNQLNRYQDKLGFLGLMAVCLKDSDIMIGQIGLTRQLADNKEVIEVGYILDNKYQHNGYAAEATKALIELAFNKGIDEVYSIIKYNNYASQKVAINNNMNKVGEFIKIYKGIEMPHYIYKVVSDVSRK